MDNLAEPLAYLVKRIVDFHNVLNGFVKMSVFFVRCRHLASNVVLVESVGDGADLKKKVGRNFSHSSK